MGSLPEDDISVRSICPLGLLHPAEDHLTDLVLDARELAHPIDQHVSLLEEWQSEVYRKEDLPRITVVLMTQPIHCLNPPVNPMGLADRQGDDIHQWFVE